MNKFSFELIPRNNNCITNNLLGMKENEKVKFDSHLNSKHDELPVHEYVKDVIFYFKIFTIIIRIFHVKCLKSVCPMKVNIQSINATSTQFFLGTGLPNRNSQLVCMCLGDKGPKKNQQSTSKPANNRMYMFY